MGTSVLPPAAESEPDWSQHANYASDAPSYHGIVEKKIKAAAESSSSKATQRPVPGGWWKPKRWAKADHKALRLHCHFRVASNEMKSSSLFLCHHLCHIIPQRSTPRSQKGFRLKYINLSSLSCHHSNWDLMYLPLHFSPPLPLPFYWYRVVLASVSICPFPYMSAGQNAVSKTYHLSSGVLDH